MDHGDARRGKEGGVHAWEGGWEERGDSIDGDGRGGGGGPLCFAFLHLQDVPIRHLFLLCAFYGEVLSWGREESCVNKNTVS